MIFATEHDLLIHVGTSVTALAEVATPDDHAVVSGDLLRLTIEGGDRSALDPEEIAAADEALVNIVQAHSRADNFMTGRLRNKYPDNTAIAGDESLKGINCDIALYYLHGLRTDDDVIRRYKDAVRDLGLIASGQIHIGIETADASQAVGHPEVDAPARIFSGDTLKDF